MPAGFEAILAGRRLRVWRRVWLTLKAAAAGQPKSIAIVLGVVAVAVGWVMATEWWRRRSNARAAAERSAAEPRQTDLGEQRPSESSSD